MIVASGILKATMSPFGVGLHAAVASREDQPSFTLVQRAPADSVPTARHPSFQPLNWKWHPQLACLFSERIPLPHAHPPPPVGKSHAE